MIYNVRDYGVIDGAKPQTAAIQDVIDLCHENGGGEVIVPEGMYRVAGLLLRSGVALHLLSGAMLLGSDRSEDYSEYLSLISEEERTAVLSTKARPSTVKFSKWNNGVIKAINAENVAIVGDRYSYIDGVNCYDGNGEEGYRGPHGINIWNCKGVRLEGYTLMNSANWAHAIFGCEDVSIKGVTVKGGHDGIDIFRCKNVKIEECDLATGDDCVAGYGNLDVEIRNCTFNSACSILRFGGRNVHVHDCTHTSPAKYPHRYKMTDEEKRTRVTWSDECRTNTLTAFLFYSDKRFEPLAPQGNVLIERCAFSEVDALFHMNYGNHIWCCEHPMSSITFKDCTATVRESSYIAADSDTPFTLTLDGVKLTAAEGCEDAPVIDGTIFDRIELTDTELQGFSDPRVTVRCNGKIVSHGSTQIKTEKKEYALNTNSK